MESAMDTLQVVRVDHDLAGIVARAEALTDQLVEAELLRTG